MHGAWNFGEVRFLWRLMNAQTFDIRGIDEGLYDLVFKGWWEGHRMQPVPLEVLPKCGVFVGGEDDAEADAVAWLYMDNSIGVAWVSWITSNPALSAVKAAKALSYLLESVEEVAKELNYGLLFTMTDRDGLGRFLGKREWKKNHSGMTQYFKGLG